MKGILEFVAFFFWHSRKASQIDSNVVGAAHQSIQVANSFTSIAQKRIAEERFMNEVIGKRR